MFSKIKENIVVEQATACSHITHLLQSESDNNFGEADQWIIVHCNLHDIPLILSGKDAR